MLGLDCRGNDRFPDPCYLSKSELRVQLTELLCIDMKERRTARPGPHHRQAIPSAVPAARGGYLRTRCSRRSLTCIVQVWK